MLSLFPRQYLEQLYIDTVSYTHLDVYKRQEETTDMLKSMGFKMSLTCNEGINHITDTDSLFMLKRYNLSLIHIFMNGNRIQIKRRQFEQVIDKLDAI